ncbi:inverse autotransporter beta domain-containing protein [Veillonella sp.]|uniref:inverse autotransporter beta domain-containing protein n=1 Tax=Veillonella sp. TaxID=1926307 RepID=UPI0028FFD45B|nr:inverse autotransporter beta domain-containing protein [Veillonella sp.]MDU1130448.1 inverse autotransporter beta domain-containing protein [Veillonella sp.]MDU2869627.1 inverse autotransporter beta domain-containing protein [Veillonella sp.]
MKRIICVALSALLCCVGSAEAEKQQLHKGADQSVQRAHTLTVATNTREEQVKAAAEGFHITPAATPDHVIGEGGPLVMDRQETKTVQYSDVDAVNRAINAVAMSNVSNVMYGAKGKPWMRRTTLSFQFQEGWKPLYSVETVQPLGHYDDASRYVWFTQQRISRASDIGTTLNVGVGYRRISKDDRRLYGAHLFYDHRFLRHHDRLSAGLEYMSGESEFRFNWYGSASDERVLDANLHNLERVANGYTLEYGKTFKNARWARVYVEGYHWNQERQADKNGLRVGSELQLTPRVSVDMGYNKPENNSGGAYGKITFRLAGSSVAWYGGKHRVEGAMSVRSKMLSLVRRHHTIWVE